MLLGIICNEKSHEIDTLQAVNHMYLTAVADYMSVQPVLIPAAMPERLFNALTLIGRLDGVLVTGNRSNVHPSYYGVEPDPAYEPYDRPRDVASLSLIDAALRNDTPLLAICRGMQELNVVCGGSLANKIHKQDGILEHRMPRSDTHEERFAPQHMVQFSDDGYLQNLLGTNQAMTNSLHSQAVDKLGDNLVVEATTEDGIIEAVRHTTAHYCVGVQWHPEYQSGENIISEKLFGDFERAMRERANNG